MDSISDEATNTDREDTPIILICTDRRNKSDDILIKLFSIGIYSAILGNDRNVDISENINIKAWTKFYFPGRNGKYSDFCWNWTHFHGIDWDENRQKAGIYKFYGKNKNKT